MNPADPSTIQRQSELTAVINTCNKANVAIYPIDVRGLVTPFGAAPKLQIFPDDYAPAQLVSATLHLGGEGADAPARLVYVQHGGGT